ncbi:DNA replication/repair protein RecF [Ekhidna sp. To15]|uniref:DNA replication/repair protein RecF n=1 Tax=Ekhidna sp. To15 TaxID=3395267 RepID=UPI003F522B35
MILKSLRLTDFKNHSESQFEFEDRINCVLGKNGVGKTNLLDAIYYLSFTKSAVGSQDRFAISHDQRAFTIHGTYDDLTIALQFEKGKVKTLKIDGQEPGRLSDVIGKVPLVIVLPDDTSMIKEGSEERRKFFDGALSQFDDEYLQSLLQYNKLLKQRNSLLKQAEGRKINPQLLDTYDEQLIPLAMTISGKRREVREKFLPFLKKNYTDLHDGSEAPSLTFKSHVDDSFEERYKANQQKDQIMQRTLLGSHRDDFEFMLNGELIKKFGSQGQQKTFIIALKLALYDFLREQTGKKPLLLLDDIFDKLDDSRIQLLVSLLLDSDRFEQIFISDARKDRSKVLFKKEKAVKFIDL